MADFTNTGEFKLESDLKQFEQGLQSGQTTFKDFVDVVSFGAKQIIKEGNLIGNAFKDLGQKIAAPLNRISASYKKFAAITTGTMAFAAEGAQKFYTQTRILEQIVKHSNHELERQAHRLEELGLSAKDAKEGIIDFSGVLKDASRIAKQYEISQKDVMIGMSNLAGVLPNANNEWERFIGLAKFAQQHHPQFGDMTTQMTNLTTAIASGNTRMIRHISGNITLSKVYDEAARKLGKTASAMTQMEKASATLEAIEKQIGDTTKFASGRLNQQVSIVNSVSRIWLSLGRIIFPFWNGLKKIIASVLAPIADALEEVAGGIDKLGSATEKQGSVMKHFAEGIGEMVRWIAVAYAWIVKLIVKMVAVPFRAFALGFSIVGLSAGAAATAIAGFFSLVGSTLFLGSLIKLIKILKDFAFAILGITKPSTTVLSAFKDMSKGFLTTTTEAGKALTAFDRLGKGVSNFGKGLAQTKAGIKSLNLFKTLLPKEGFLAFEAAFEGLFGGGAGAVGKGAAGLAGEGAKGAAGGLGLGGGASGERAAAAGMKILSGAAKVTSNVVKLLTGYVGSLAKAVTDLFGPFKNLGAQGGIVNKVFTKFTNLMTALPRMITSVSKSTSVFTQSLLRVTASTGQFNKVMELATLQSTKAGMAGEHVARIFTGRAGITGAGVGRLSAMGKALGGIFRIFKGMGPVLLKLLGPIAIIFDVITIARAIFHWLKWRKLVQETREELEKSAIANQKLVAQDKLVGGDIAERGDKETAIAFKKDPIQAIDQQKESIRSANKALIDLYDLTADASRKGNIFDNAQLQRNIKQIKELDKLQKAIIASKSKNIFANKIVLEMDKKIESQAGQMWSRLKDVRGQLSKLGTEGKGTPAFNQLNQQIADMAVNIGVSTTALEGMTNESEFLNTAIQQIWKVSGADILKGLDQQLQSAKDGVAGLREQIIGAKESAEQFVLSFKMGESSAGGPAKAAANLDLLMQQFERAKDLDVRPEKLASQAKDILGAIDQLSGARMEEFMQTPQGRASQMQISSMQRANPAAAAQMSRDLKAQIDQATRAEFGAGAVLAEYQLLEDKALDDEQEKLNQAKELLKDIEVAAFVFYETMRKNGSAAKEIQAQLKLFPSLLEKINEQAEIFAGFTGKAKSDLDGATDGLSSTARVQKETFDPEVLRAAEKRAGLDAGSLSSKAKLEESPEFKKQKLAGLEADRQLLLDTKTRKARGLSRGLFGAEFADVKVDGQRREFTKGLTKEQEVATQAKLEENTEQINALRSDLGIGDKAKLTEGVGFKAAGDLLKGASNLGHKAIAAIGNLLTGRQSAEQEEKTRIAIREITAELNETRSNQGLASGGKVRGPGGIDNIPIWASKDEVVIRPEVSRPWMQQLLEFNATGDPSVFLNGGKGFRAGGRVGKIGFQTGGVVSDNGLGGLLSANHDVLNIISEKLDGLININDTLAAMLEQLSGFGQAITVNVQIPDSKISFDPLPVHLMIDDVGKLALKQDLEELQPRPRTEGFGNF